MRSVIGLISMFALCAPVHAAGKQDTGTAETLIQALKQGKFGVGLRYRYETVADDDPLFMGRDGDASTLRTTLSYETAAYRNVRARVEVEDVTDVGRADDHANAGAGSLGNGVSGRPTVADPEITEINQATLRYDGVDRLAIEAGRSEVNLGQQRFVGAVGWRQHHQTFDMARVDVERIPRTKLTYAFLDRVHRIFGDSKSMDTHVVMAEVDAGTAGKATVYGLLLDYAMPADAPLSTDTWGVRFAGDAGVSRRWRVTYHAESARQSDAGANPGRIDAGYHRLEVGAKVERWWFKIGREVLEGSAADGRFTTPLATLHKWSGWADKFLVTPPAGIEETYYVVGTSRGRFSGTVALLEFASESGFMDYGTEIDVQALYKMRGGQKFGIKAAIYDAEGFAADTEKLWAWAAFAF